MKVTLPDGSSLDLPDGATGADAAAAIGPGLAKAALAVRVNGDLRDLARPLDDGVPIEIVTDRSDDALALIRHDAAHVLATAVMELRELIPGKFGIPDWNVAMAGTLIIMLPPLVLVMFMQRWFVRGLIATEK